MWIALGIYLIVWLITAVVVARMEFRMARYDTIDTRMDAAFFGLAMGAVWPGFLPVCGALHTMAWSTRFVFRGIEHAEERSRSG